MKTLQKNKRIAIVAITILMVSILAVSIGLIVSGVEKSRKVVAENEDGQMLSGKVYDMPKQLTLTNDERAVSDGVNLKVNLKPIFALSKINFALRWKENGVDKDINNYLTLTIMSDTQCNIKIKQRFNDKIELVASAEINNNITKTCEVDCYSYLESMNMTIEIHNKELFSQTGKITANSTDKIYGKPGNSLVSMGSMIVAGSLDITYYKDSYIVVKGDYSFGFGTKLFFNKIGSTFQFKMGTSMAPSGEDSEENMIIDLSKTMDLTNKNGSFEFESVKFNLDYFYNNRHFANWYVNAAKKWTDLPTFADTKEFYYNNVNNFMQDMIINFSFDLYYADKSGTASAITALLGKNVDYMYDFAFDDSVVME